MICTSMDLGFGASRQSSAAREWVSFVVLLMVGFHGGLRLGELCRIAVEDFVVSDGIGMHVFLW